MAKQTFTTGQVLTAAQVNSLQANDFNQTVSVKTASYTLVAADKGTRIEFNTSGSVTCTVNTGLFDAGDTVIIQNRGSGTVTVTAGTATVNTNASLAVAQYGYGTLYFISASASIFFADAGGIPASAFTAKGDILVGTGSGTYDKLGVGANGTNIVADSATATGLKWAAPAASGGLTLLNTGGTSLAGSVSTTVSSISGAYKNLHIYVDAAYVASNQDALGLRINSESGANTYHEVRIERYGTTTSTNGTTGSTIILTAVCGNTDTGNFFYGMIPNYADTTHRKTIQGQAYYKHDSTNSFQIWGGARVNSNDAVDAITIVNLGGNNISGGTLFIYGEN